MPPVASVSPSWHGCCITQGMQEIAVLASRALTMRNQFNAVADNVANVNTAGYRRIEMDFKEVLSRQNPQSRGLSYVQDRSISLNQTDGALQQTGNPLDAAISGPGFFAIEVNGTTQYTRKGQFVLNAEGQLSTPEGYAVLDNAGAPIQFQPEVRNIRLANDGTLSTEQGQLAQIGVYQFSPEGLKTLQRAGNTAFVPGSGGGPVALETPIIRQGYIEASNVNAVQEMVTMQMVSKAYESSLSSLQSLSELESRAIRTLGGSQ
ncbi:MAG: flagellar hook basal-body protein [Proteobacteria bacterium]|nr:flagellar hook basal-body protein [Pseudomonadota bacterium]